MADLIDRNALLKDLRIECPESDVCNNCAPCIECIVNRQPAVNRWIPCSERLPEQNCEVLVCCYGSDLILTQEGETLAEAIERTRRECVTVTVGFIGSDGWYGADWMPLMVEPTFWMPLPAAPEPPEKE